MTKAPTDVRSLGRAHTETAINVLTAIMTSDKTPAAARVAAAQALFARGWGKAPQTIEAPKDHRPVVKPQWVADWPDPIDLNEWLRIYAPKEQAEGTVSTEGGASLPPSPEQSPDASTTNKLTPSSKTRGFSMPYAESPPPAIQAVKGGPLK